MDGVLTEPGSMLDAQESGLTARIAIALATLVDGVTRIDGTGRLRQRPLAPLLDALTAQGVSISSRGGLLPVTVTGRGGLWGGDITVDSTTSSQFATALMVVAPLTREPTTLRLEGDRGAQGYVEMTSRVMSAFGATVDQTITGYEISNSGYQAADLLVEPDVSAAVYPMVAAAITGSRVEIEAVGWDTAQPDLMVARCLEEMGCRVGEGADGLVIEGPAAGLEPIEAEMASAPDGALALAVACLFAKGRSRISGLATLRLKESDRLTAMGEGLRSLGAEVTIAGDTMTIEPGVLEGAVVRGHGDHRVVMSLALAGLVVEGVTVDDPGVVSKTWPAYWEAMRSLTSG
jgi:3-phosphoshikimate 1-carboxyvinyltransferase